MFKPNDEVLSAGTSQGGGECGYQDGTKDRLCGVCSGGGMLTAWMVELGNIWSKIFNQELVKAWEGAGIEAAFHA